MKTIKISDKEILVQLALGTLHIFLLHSIVLETNNPIILIAAAKTFAKLEVDGASFIAPSILNIRDADLITSAFMNNEHTPQLVKSYVIVARQIKNIERHKQNLVNGPEPHPPYFYNASIKPLQKEFEKIHRQLFFDD